MDISKIEDRIDKAAAGSTVISMNLGGVQFQSMMELMEFAKLMAVSGMAVPYHLRLNPGACLAICTRALRFGFDPFALAEHSFSMKKDVDVTIEKENGGRVTEKRPVETIAYDSYVIRAVIEAHAPIKGRLRYAYAEAGDARTCTVSATLRDGGDTVSHTSPTLGERKRAIGTSEKGNLKGSPLWLAKPDVQLGYDTARDLCRLHFPEVLMGWYDKDEMDEMERATEARNITPTVGDRLREKKDKKPTEGFNTPKITQQMSEVVPDKIIEREKVEALTQAREAENRAAKGEASGDEAPRETVTERDTPERSGTAREAPSDHQGTQSAARFSSDDPSIAIMQEAQSGSVAATPTKPDKTPAKRSKRAPVAEAKPLEETPLQRGTRLLPMQGDKHAVEDLQQSIAQELGSAESEQWIALCEARIDEVKS